MSERAERSLHEVDVAEHQAARRRRVDRRYLLRAQGATFEEAITCWPREDRKRWLGDGGPEPRGDDR